MKVYMVGTYHKDVVHQTDVVIFSIVPGR